MIKMTNNHRLNIYEKTLTLSTFFVVILNAFLSYIEGITSYGIYASEFLWICIVMLQGKIYVRKNAFYLTLLLLASGIIASIYGNFVIGGVLNELQRHFSFTVCFFVAVSIRWDILLSKSFTQNFLRVLLYFGVFATIYAFVFQGKYIIAIITGTGNYYDMFTSFFSQRNVYAAFLLLCSFACIYFYSISRNKIYLIIYFIFVVQMYLASSKASLIGALLFFFLYLFFETRNKFLFIIIGGVILVPLTIEVGYPLLNGLSHATLEGVTSTEIRFSDWTRGIDKLIEGRALLFGYGMGSEALYLSAYRSYGSFHNVYLDLLFQGGIIKLAIYIYSLHLSCKWVAASEDKNYRNVFFPSIITIAIYSFVESGCMLYSINYHSLLTTVIFAILPQCKASLHES